MNSSYVLAIVTIVAIVLVAGLTYRSVTGRKDEKVDKTEITDIG